LLAGGSLAAGVKTNSVFPLATAHRLYL